MTFCGMDCCKDCGRLNECGGCEKCNGHPFGESCIAERYSNFHALKVELVEEINSLDIDGLLINDLYLLNGSYVNLEYPLFNGSKVKLLNDKDVYLGNQVEISDSERCFGVVANENFILVCEYGCNGVNPELVIYSGNISNLPIRIVSTSLVYFEIYSPCCCCL